MIKVIKPKDSVSYLFKLLIEVENSNYTKIEANNKEVLHKDQLEWLEDKAYKIFLIRDEQQSGFYIEFEEDCYELIYKMTWA